jgi:hypothetical protein
MSSTASPFFVGLPVSRHGRERQRISAPASTRGATRHGGAAGADEALGVLSEASEGAPGDLPATPTIALLRVTCGLSAEQAEQLLTEAETRAQARRFQQTQPASWDHTAFYALLGVAAIVISQLLF